ncbi:hypothetical protein MPH_09807 [Macrophomina phaseolina MS6]|uniref:Uncharacterized protein n=1 Tax=Macrophomina phaseolina (strain MS6) TaxID=1126212 RepID=K2RJW8_MACPH|nr:hypothetical protein MPH_09807 [Macrophomina phaseolina MS6]
MDQSSGRKAVSSVALNLPPRMTASPTALLFPSGSAVIFIRQGHLNSSPGFVLLDMAPSLPTRWRPSMNEVAISSSFSDRYDPKYDDFILQQSRSELVAYLSGPAKKPKMPLLFAKLSSRIYDTSPKPGLHAFSLPSSRLLYRFFFWPLAATHQAKAVKSVRGTVTTKYIQELAAIFITPWS